MAPGLRAVWDAADMDRHCNYTMQACHFFNMLAPDFHEGDVCEIHHIEYLSGREEFRILRNLMLLNIVSYSIYSEPLLEIDHKKGKLYYAVKILTMLVFIVSSVAVPIIFVDPFKYPTSFKTVFNIIEAVIVGISIGFLIYNLWLKRINDQQEEEPMKTELHIFPRH
ncbi:unnamed protein product [Didymodactylos carnosus]|nr:unnamed protein product [Didymodactylos carnosus]CAF1544956.1 unnamed protein product [Didymodactylos carnosus]CAF4333819.1 unnamed protein product [Didymodactylos carnosus]CAF4391202.1 unnamed protein product [Didymodactylos carnosus]